MMRRVAFSEQNVGLISVFEDRRTASARTKGAFDSILGDRKRLMTALGEAAEKYELIGRAEKDFYYLIARSLTSTRDDLGQNPRSNGNGDCFIHSELGRTHSEFKVPNYQTFVGRGTFTNHQSDKVEACFGTHLAVRFAYGKEPIGPADTAIHNLLAIDIARAREIGIYDGLRTGYLNTWSMGCDIQGAACSICGNLVQKDTDRRCEHILAHKGSEMIASKDVKFPWAGRRVRVADILYGPSFVELSAVTVPADYTAETMEHIGEVADIQKREALQRDAINIPSYAPVNVTDTTKERSNVVPNGDGSYTAVHLVEHAATFGDYQTALDWIDSQGSDRTAAFDDPSNFEYAESMEEAVDEKVESVEEHVSENVVSQRDSRLLVKRLIDSNLKQDRHSGLMQVARLQVGKLDG